MSQSESIAKKELIPENCLPTDDQRQRKWNRVIEFKGVKAIDFLSVIVGG
jgi:hypothetical protein